MTVLGSYFCCRASLKRSCFQLLHFQANPDGVEMEEGFLGLFSVCDSFGEVKTSVDTVRSLHRSSDDQQIRQLEH